MKKSVIAIPSSSYDVVITTTIIVYALIVTILFELDNNNNAVGGENFVVDVNDDYKTNTYNTQQVEAVAVETSSCKSPCPPTTELCIEICA